MALQKYIPSTDAPPGNLKSLNLSSKVHAKAQVVSSDRSHMESDVDVDLREVYFLIMHFLSAGPCHRTYGQLWNELLEHQLLPRRYHSWYSRNGMHSGDENDDGSSFPLSYNKLVERYPHVEKDHLVKLLKQLLHGAAASSQDIAAHKSNAAAVPTLLGTGSFSLLGHDERENNDVKRPPGYMRWPHMQADQVRGLHLREIGGGFSRHHRAPSSRAACYAIMKPSTMMQKMQNVKRLRGHRNAVYCAIFDRLGRYVITGSDDRLVKIWSMETAYCLASCRGHEGDITDLAVTANNALVASASNDCVIRVWRLADGLPISVLRGHTGAVTAIVFSPRANSMYQLLSSADDGTCRIWDARHSQFSPRIYIPKPSESQAGKSNGPSSSTSQQSHQIFCCAFNASGTVFVTGSSDTYARVWNALKPMNDDPEQPNHEMDVLAGHENDVNYVQFSGCAVTSRLSLPDASKEDNILKVKTSWFTHDNIVTCSRDGSAIIWIPKSRRSHGKVGRWTRAYHLKVPPPPMPPQPSRGGPRQRFLPTPRGVNMIVWSLDNRFVLAAIMDNRICVWNAVDGSLVHSLTGHTDSTYVLDVHPFNPRIAMSAGYDGKTIVWDIWEGTPIRVYEIARFKLVDGKFSPDGTSIILSDDVGQLYILSTGQGESQKDAKYDQFFLGDYRPLIHDTHGNILDQETQLPPYRRNMQDLLCDSGMIPYPEPYQSMYQQRRLGALGIEWRPSSMRFAVGTDISLDQEYQIPPIADLDILIDPLPEFLDAMEWEPEIELQSEDNDSEYNVTADEYHSEGEQGSLSSNSSRDLDSSAEDSEDQRTYDDSLRRSKRKKIKVEAEIMTSSGRRVKRRNLDECDANSSRNKNRSRKSRSERKASKKKKSSVSKSARPQRAAARNALTLFSRITGKSTDAEDEDGLEYDSSGSESILDDSNNESEEPEVSLENEKNERSKGKELLLDVPEDVISDNHYPESRLPMQSRRKIVFKLPRRDSKTHLSLEDRIECPNQPDVVGSSSTAHQEADESSRIDSRHQAYASADENGEKAERNEKQTIKIINRSSLLEGYEDGNIRWGGVKSRSAKRSRTGEPVPSDPHVGPSSCLDGTAKVESFVNGHSRSEKECFTLSSSSELNNERDNVDETDNKNPHLVGPESLEVINVSDNQAEQSEIVERRVYDENVDDRETTSIPYRSETDSPLKMDEKPSMLPTNPRIMSRVLSRDQANPNKLIIRSSGEDPRNSDAHPVPQSKPVVPSDDRASTATLVGTQIDSTSRSVSEDSQNLHSRDRMFRAVYRRTKSVRISGSSENNGGGMEASTSNARKSNLDEEIETTNQGVRRTRSMGVGSTSRDVRTVHNHANFRAIQSSSEDASTSIEERSEDRDDEPCHEELRSSSRVNVGLRSARSRRSTSYVRESPPGRKKQNQPAKSSWLTLSKHEEGSRYIPQLGDEVVYLRQGHQEYMENSHSREVGPWKKIKGDIRAVEFCSIKDLEYATVPGSGESCCKLRLEFVDPMSNVAGKSFELTLPDLTDFPDFLVERSRYDAAIDRKWTNRDKCQVWWKNEDSENGGDWWEGRVKSVQPKSIEFPDSPWDRFSVQYKGDSRVLQHSPWELYDAGTQWEQPHIDPEVRDKLVDALVKLEQSGNKAQDRYGVQKLKQESQKTTFLNRFAVPLTLEVIRLRLENNYYRRLGAMKHDVEVMLSNAESFFEKKADLFAKIERLRDWFRRTLSSL